MGQPRRNHANNLTIGVMTRFLYFLIATLLHSSSYVNSSRYPSTMGIAMPAAISKEKPTRTAITPKQAQRSTRLSKSPRSNNINSLLAEINLPMSRLNNILEALRPTTGRDSQKDNNLNDPCYLESPIEKNNQITTHASPTGVDTHTLGVPTPVNYAEPPANKSPQDQSTPPNSGVCWRVVLRM
jgi:hypothetical protein